MNFKLLTPHAIAILILLAVATVFFAPNAFNGKVLPQPDNDKARGMQTEVRHYLQSDGKAPLWTNSTFGGMPAYQIYSKPTGNLTLPIYKSLFLWTAITAVWAQVFVAMFCLYFLLMVLGADWRVAVFGAVAYGITSYNVDILEAGHSTKMAALALAPGILAGVVLTFNGRLWLGAGLTALFLSMQLYANHVQITYYTLLICGLYFIARLIEAARTRTIGGWALALAAVIGAMTLGLGANISRIWPTYEYGTETIRGGSDLKARSDHAGGLSKDYLFGWSYGVGESMTLLVPHFAGGGANESFTNTALYKKLRSAYADQMTPQQADRQTAGLLYTGDQPFVGTAIYFGAIVVFLGFLGAFLARGSLKWWLLSSGLFMLSLAWGKYFFLNDIWYDILPMFKKFRAVSMALGPAQLCFAALGALGLQALAGSDIDPARKRRALYISAGISVGMCLLAIGFAPDSGQNDDALAQSPELLRLLRADRADLVRSDAFRSIGFILAAAALLWAYLQGWLKAGIAVLAVAGLALLDHWMVCRRTLDNDKFETKREALAEPEERDFDKEIKKDPDPHYRVLDLSRGAIAGNATTSYFHKSLSGYHAAKLQRYQTVVDTFLSEKLGQNLHIVGMFNGKYIVDPKGQVIRNPEAAGHAWFVRHYDVVASPDAELHALGALNPRDTAVLVQSEAAALQGFKAEPDSTAKIDLTSYHPDRMEYTYSSKVEQLAVFPEIYYPPAKGWKTYLNGQPAADFFKVDYLLRGMRLPAGQDMKLEMRFEPRSFYLGEKLALGASLLTLLLFGAGLWFFYRRSGLNEANRLIDVEPAQATRPPAAAPGAAAAKPRAQVKKKK